MLHELKPVRQVPGDLFRRWFADENLEAVIWYDPAGAIAGFQLCYDLRSEPRALTWTLKRGFSHASLDDGDDKPTSNRTPILRISANHDTALLWESFLASGGGLPATEKALIEGKLAEWVRDK